MYFQASACVSRVSTRSKKRRRANGIRVKVGAVRIKGIGQQAGAGGGMGVGGGAVLRDADMVEAYGGWSYEARRLSKALINSSSGNRNAILTY